MPHTVRVNLANPAELFEFPGIGPDQVRSILAFRAEHGPIQDASQLAAILRPWSAPDAMWDRVGFDLEAPRRVEKGGESWRPTSC
jgi:hypothetical protein